MASLRLLSAEELTFRNVDKMRHKLVSIWVFVSFWGFFLFVFFSFWCELGVLLDQIQVRFKPLIDPDTHLRVLCGHHRDECLPPSYVARAHAVLDVGHKRMLLDHFEVPFDQLLDVKHVFGAFYIVLALVSIKIQIWVHLQPNRQHLGRLIGP